MQYTISENDEIVMKLLHYFITEQNYNPIILQGAQNEIWLENLNGEHKIVRIVSNYIHNDEQFNFDIFRAKQITKKIKKKTMSLSVKTLSIFTNLGENVSKKNINYDNIDCVYLNEIEDLEKYDFIKEEFPSITKKVKYSEEGMELFLKLTNEISKKSEKDKEKADDVFKMKKPVVTYAIIAINIVLFLLMYIFGNGSQDSQTLINFGANFAPLVKNGEYYRLITNAFLHIGILHLIFNCYALYVIGPQVESFFGKTKYIIIYLMSAIFGSLLSNLFNPNSLSAGASGAIFGLLGSILYFGYHYRVYLENVLKSQIFPLIILNLLLGFMTPGIDNACHIGGLIGGILVSKAVGVKYKSTKEEKINGIVMSVILFAFLIYMVFIRLV